MNRAEWRRELGELVRGAMRSAELDHYFKVKITKAGAQVLSSRMAKRWMDDLGFGWEQVPNFKVHSQADEKGK